MVCSYGLSPFQLKPEPNRGGILGHKPQTYKRGAGELA